MKLHPDLNKCVFNFHFLNCHIIQNYDKAHWKASSFFLSMISSVTPGEVKCFNTLLFVKYYWISKTKHMHLYELSIESYLFLPAFLLSVTVRLFSRTTNLTDKFYTAFKYYAIFGYYYDSILGILGWQLKIVILFQLLHFCSKDFLLLNLFQLWQCSSCRFWFPGGTTQLLAKSFRTSMVMLCLLQLLHLKKCGLYSLVSSSPSVHELM